ncbi:hypothetical protein GCM10011613_22950 [Cellvibrio zantedeschiae]|uniref:DUF4398 domain-containing protein n=1 Tax=Cellvibrio zantedeschiae TaxID=1237077 RepID=A0ABQ3B3U7_9GAMM|nr:DUF4398 domain-containing protein [Cellvibrio zantedeschiae]GGY77782.1 hypothetical protein GCM10011613_22950 [Cellvibrio zantedeschiae]
MIRNIKYLHAREFNHLFLSKIRTVGSAVIAAIVLAACASTPPPNSQITAAETAIAHAEQAQVADYSSPELVEARKHLAAAKAEVADKNMTTAARLAQKAHLNADLAMAQAATAKAKEVNDELQKGNSVIKQELQRNQGAQ